MNLKLLASATIGKRQRAARTRRRFAPTNRRQVVECGCPLPLSGLQAKTVAIAARFALLGLPALTLAQPPILTWHKLSSIPDRVGFAGSFAGVSDGALLVGGGANFSNKMPWDGGEKVWHDSLFVLPEPTGEWISGFKLPQAIGYGVSITTPEGVLCAGGADAHQHFRDVFLLKWNNGKIRTESLPPLPSPMGNGCGALIGTTIYLPVESSDLTPPMR